MLPRRLDGRILSIEQTIADALGEVGGIAARVLNLETSGTLGLFGCPA